MVQNGYKPLKSMLCSEPKVNKWWFSLVQKWFKIQIGGIK
jgi:hypothetical protein